MVDQNKINEILTKSKQINELIDSKKKKNQELSNKLIELNTKKQQILEELKSMNISEDYLEFTINNLYKDIQDGIAKFEELNK